MHKIIHPMHTDQRQFHIREEPSGMEVSHATIPTLGRLRQENYHKYKASQSYARSQLKKLKAMRESKKMRRNLSKGENTQPIKGLTPTKENAGTQYPCHL